MTRPTTVSELTLPHSQNILQTLESELRREERKLEKVQKDIFHNDIQRAFSEYMSPNPSLKPYLKKGYGAEVITESIVPSPSFLNEVLELIVEKYPDTPMHSLDEEQCDTSTLERIKNLIKVLTDKLHFSIVDDFRNIDVNQLIYPHFTKLCYEVFFTELNIKTLNRSSDTEVCQRLYDYIYFWYIHCVNKRRKLNQSSSNSQEQLADDIARFTKQIALTKHSIEKEQALFANKEPVVFNKAQIKELCTSLPQIDASKVRLLESSDGYYQYLEFATQNITATVRRTEYNECESERHCPTDIQQHVRIPNMVWQVNLTECYVKARKLRHNHQHESAITPQQPFFQQPWEMPRSFSGYSNSKVPAPHFTSPTTPCLGDFTNIVEDSIAKRDLHGIMSSIISFLSSVDPADAAGKTWYNLVSDYTYLNDYKMIAAFQMPYMPYTIARGRETDWRAIDQIKFPEGQTSPLAIADWWDDEILQPLAPWQEDSNSTPVSGYIDRIFPIYQFRADGSYRALLIYLSQNDITRYMYHTDDEPSLDSLLQTYYHHFDTEHLWRHKNYHQIILGHGNLGALV